MTIILPRWRQELVNSIRTIEQLKKIISISKDEEEKIWEVIKHYQMSITPYYASLMNPEDPEDPLKKIVVPSGEELSEDGNFDTSGESDNTKVQGLQHKYEKTVLLLPTPVCTSYCRYCFRKRFTTGSFTKQETNIDWNGAFDYLRNHQEVNNVLITGGDPLILSNKKLDYILSNLRKTDHIKIIRLGTKFPAFNPFRLLDPEFLDMISKYSLLGKKIYIVAHFDHPRELTPESLAGLEAVMKAGAQVVNQTVFHKGINDNPETLRDLFNKLADAGVIPYYLFQLRPVKGSMRYRLPLIEGIKIFNHARKHLNGLARQVRYIMSHFTGKIEVLGFNMNISKIILKYHSSRNENVVGRIFSVSTNNNLFWLNDFPKLGLLKTIKLNGGNKYGKM